MDLEEGRKGGSPPKYTFSVFPGVCCCFLDGRIRESLNVGGKEVTRIKPMVSPDRLVRPIDRCSGYVRLCIGRIKVEELSKAMLKAIFRDSHADIDVIEEDNFFILQYKTHLPICISKKDGRFYSWHEGLEQEARIIWEILRKYGYIENPRRIKITKKKKIFEEEIK